MSLSPTQQQVLDSIREFPGQTVRALHEREDMPLGTISGCLQVLREKGHVKPNPERNSPLYGLLYPTESTECPAPAVAEFTVDWLPSSENTTNGTESTDTPGTVASVDPVSPSILGATPAPLAQTESVIASPSDAVTIEDYSTLGDAARELAAENARLRDDLASVRELLGENLIEPTLCHLSDVLVDAGVFIPTCDRAPNCKSLHLLSRIHELADGRDTLRVENANLRYSVRDLRLSCNRYQDDLAEIAALCLFLGFDGSGDTMDMVLWLLTTLGGGEAVHAFRRRQLLQAEAMELEAQSLNWRRCARDWMGKAQALAAVGPCPRVGE